MLKNKCVMDIRIAGAQCTGGIAAAIPTCRYKAFVATQSLGVKQTSPQFIYNASLVQLESTTPHPQMLTASSLLVRNSSLARYLFSITDPVYLSQIHS